MQHAAARRFFLRIALPCAALAIPAFWLRSVLAELLTVAAGAAAIAFLTAPLTRLYERRLPGSFAALAALATLPAALGLGGWLLLPALVRQATQLMQTLPQITAMLGRAVSRAESLLCTVLPGAALPDPGVIPLPDLQGTIALAGSVAGAAYKGTLMAVLGYFFLRDRSRLLLRLELLVPRRARCTAVRMGRAVCRELKLYLRGQLIIALSVGALSALGLALVGSPSPLALGGLVGLLNMIPYFGPILGGIPAVLVALNQSWQTAALTLAVLWGVQQIDGSFISPRILGSLTGLSPGTVLLAIFAGSGISGIVGMLLALPVVMTFRTVFRVFVQRRENV